MTLDEFIAMMNARETVVAGSDAHQFMVALSNDAMRVTAELNSSYKTPAEIRELMSKLTGTEVPTSFVMFPPFTTDCGKNTTFGENVFVNCGCRFQNQGGITIGKTP